MLPLQVLCAGVLSSGPIPVIAYHAFGGPAEFAGGPRFDVHGLNIPVSVFRRQLELMYAKDFWPINARDLARRRLEVPKGKHPIVLTFDDARPSQFRYLAKGTIDPDCAVGVMVWFHHCHPDWPLRGSFYLIAGSDANGVPFDQEGLEGRKVQKLLQWGFEIGNHSFTHPSFRALSRRQIVREVAGGDAYLKNLVPGIEVDTLALPYGDMPLHRTEWSLLRRGSFKGHRYWNIGVLLFDAGLCPSPFSRGFDPFRIPRIVPKPGYVEGVLDKLSTSQRVRGGDKPVRSSQRSHSSKPPLPKTAPA